MELVEKAVQKLISNFKEKLVAVVLFGSFARNETKEKSDFDFFIVVRNMQKSYNRRFKIYDVLYKVLKRDITIIDVDEKEIFKTDLEVTPLLLNIAYDGKILYDPEKKLTRLFEQIKSLIKELKIEKYKTPNGKYGWKTKNGTPLKPVKV